MRWFDMGIRVFDAENDYDENLSTDFTEFTDDDDWDTDDEDQDDNGFNGLNGF